MTSFIGELYLVWTIEISMQSILGGLVQTVNSDRDVFWVLSDSHYHELLWRDLAWIIIIVCKVFVALLLFTTTVVNLLVLNSSKFLGVWIWVWTILATFLIQSWRLSICENSILEEVDWKWGGSLEFSNHKEKKGVFVFVLRPLLGTHVVDICTNRSCCTIWH